MPVVNGLDYLCYLNGNVRITGSVLLIIFSLNCLDIYEYVITFAFANCSTRAVLDNFQD